MKLTRRWSLVFAGYVKYTYLSPDPQNVGEQRCLNTPTASAFFGTYMTPGAYKDQQLPPPPLEPPTFAFIPALGIWKIKANSNVGNVICVKSMATSAKVILRTDNPNSSDTPGGPIGGACF